MKDWKPNCVCEGKVSLSFIALHGRFLRMQNKLSIRTMANCKASAYDTKHLSLISRSECLISVLTADFPTAVLFVVVL